MTILASATVSMMLDPDRFLISSANAGWPLIRAKLVGSSNVRRIVATSANVTTVSPRTLTGISNTSSMFSIKPGTFKTTRPAPLSIAPAAIKRLFRLIWPISSSKEILYVSKTVGSIKISSSSVRDPPTSTSRMPDRTSRSSCRVAAKSLSVRSGTGPERITVKIGKSAVLISVTDGSRASSGRSTLARSTASRTLSIASSTLPPGSNSSWMLPNPSPAWEVIVFKPAREPSSVSSGLINRRSLSSGEIPSIPVET